MVIFIPGRFCVGVFLKLLNSGFAASKLMGLMNSKVEFWKRSDTGLRNVKLREASKIKG